MWGGYKVCHRCVFESRASVRKPRFAFFTRDPFLCLPLLSNKLEITEILLTQRVKIRFCPSLIITNDTFKFQLCP